MTEQDQDTAAMIRELRKSQVEETYIRALHNNENAARMLREARALWRATLCLAAATLALMATVLAVVL